MAIDDNLPGKELVDQGMADLAADNLTEAALLVLIAGPRLRGFGIPVPERPHTRPWEHLLYERLEDRLGAGAHSYYNSLIRRIVSYARARDHLRER